VITTDANELVVDIHDRMPLILAPEDYIRWLSDEPDPADLMRLFPAELMRMWPISTRVNKPENDDPSIIEPMRSILDAAAAIAQAGVSRGCRAPGRPYSARSREAAPSCSITLSSPCACIRYCSTMR